MRPIPARLYFDEEQFELEHERLFHAQWQFIAVTSDLEQHQDFVCRRIGKFSVVVQNFEGELRAFLNVCSHRFAEIRTTECGNGPLRCLYHGWTYNREGVPTGIPSRPYFKDLKEQLPGLHLRRFALETCGKFVFVRLAEDGPSLAEYLGEAADALRLLSTGLDVQIDRTEWHIKANWKAVVENTLEGYHIGFVHPNTFKPLGISGLDWRFHGPHSAYMGVIADEENRRVQQFRKQFAGRPFQPNGYFHQLVFPNFLTSTSHGLVTSVQYHHAVSPDETLMVSYLFHRAPDDPEKMRPAMLEVLYDAARRFNVTTMQEDQQVCEMVQRGLRQTSKAGLLSDEEERVVRFHRAYLAAMGQAADGSPLAAGNGRAVPQPVSAGGAE